MPSTSVRWSAILPVVLVALGGCSALRPAVLRPALQVRHASPAMQELGLATPDVAAQAEDEPKAAWVAPEEEGCEVYACAPVASTLELLEWDKLSAQAEQHGQSVTLAAPRLGSCASSGRAWRLWAARHSDEEAGPLGAQPLPRLLERAASKASKALFLSAQVAGFAGTASAREMLRTTGLPLPPAREGSERLLAETREAWQIEQRLAKPLELRGFHELTGPVSLAELTPARSLTLALLVILSSLTLTWP